MRALAVLLVCLSALVALGQVDAALAPATIKGVGSRWAFQTILEWGFAYELIRPHVSVDWDGQTTPQTLAAMTAGTIDFGAILSALTTTQRQGGFAQWPLTVAQTVVFYNLNKTIPDNTLNLTNDALCGIWTGRVNSWNDPLITDVNPNLPAAARSHNITVFYRSDNNGGTSTFTGLMIQVPCAAWNQTYGNRTVFSTFPSSVTSLPNFLPAGETIGACGAVAGTPWSISFAEQSWSLTNSPLLPTARLQSKDGDWASATNTPPTTEAINGVVLPESNTFNLAYLPGANVYPFISFAYLLLNTSWVPSDCDTQREVLKFFRWALIDAEAQQIALDAGAISLPPAVRASVLRQFENLTCNGERLLRIVEIKQHRGAGFPVLLAFSMVFWAVSLVCIGAAWWVGSRSKNPLFYAACLAAGTSLAFCSLIFFYIIPKEDWVCQLRQWFLCVGLSLLFGVMFARGWQLHTLHLQKDIAPVAGKKEAVSTKALMMIMGVLVGVQLIIQICWTAIDEFHSARVYPNTIDLNSRYICRSKNTVLWLVLEVAYFVGLLAFGMYVVYRTWKSRAAVDSRWTLIAIYNTLMVIFVIIPLLATVAKTDDWVFFVAVLGTDFAVMSAVGSIYGSVLLRRIWDRVSGSGSGSGSKDGKVSTFRTSMSGEGTIGEGTVA